MDETTKQLIFLQFFSDREIFWQKCIQLTIELDYGQD